MAYLKIATVAATAALAACLSVSVANAAEGEARYMSVVPPVAPECPRLQWDLAQRPPGSGQFIGVAWWSDMSGASLLRATANRSNGTFSGTLTNLGGKGPVGQLRGTSNSAGLDFSINGTGCSNLKVTIPVIVTPSEGVKG